MEDEKIDIATCSKCGRKEIFEEQKQLTAFIGVFPSKKWTTVIPFPYQLDNTTTTCPDCSNEKIGYKYILTTLDSDTIST